MVLKLMEYVDDTEDHINIMLDDKQNHLLQMGVVLTTATLVVSCFVVVVGVFGMNFGIKMFKEVQAGMSKFSMDCCWWHYWEHVLICDCYCLVQAQAIVRQLNCCVLLYYRQKYDRLLYNMLCFI
jgi:hypothetical protein